MSEAENADKNRGVITGGRAAFVRMRALVRKEFIQIRRDSSSIAIAFLMPVLLLFLFGYAVSLDVEHIPVAIVIEEPSGETMSFLSHFMRSRYFEPTVYYNFKQAEEAMKERAVDGIIYLRENFASDLHRPTGASVQVIVNGVDANMGRIILGYAGGVLATWQQYERDAIAQPMNQPVQIEQQVWFNPELRSRNYLVPGLIALIMTLIGAFLTALVMAREYERGTIEALFVTPVRMYELISGKLIAYFVLGMGGLLLSVAMGVWLFGVPLRGSFWVLMVCSGLFLLVALGMGLLISVVTKNQFVAGQTAIVVTYLPAFILSGFLFDIQSMPGAIKIITYLIPARYYVSILQTLFLAGNVWSIIIPDSMALLIMAVILLGLTYRKARKHLV